MNNRFNIIPFQNLNLQNNDLNLQNFKPVRPNNNGQFFRTNNFVRFPSRPLNRHFPLNHQSRNFPRPNKSFNKSYNRSFNNKSFKTARTTKKDLIMSKLLRENRRLKRIINKNKKINRKRIQRNIMNTAECSSKEFKISPTLSDNLRRREEMRLVKMAEKMADNDTNCPPTPVWNRSDRENFLLRRRIYEGQNGFFLSPSLVLLSGNKCLRRRLNRRMRTRRRNVVCSEMINKNIKFGDGGKFCKFGKFGKEKFLEKEIVCPPATENIVNDEVVDKKVGWKNRLRRQIV